MEKYYLVTNATNPYCIQTDPRIFVLEKYVTLFWGEHTREEESFDLSVGIGLGDVFSDFCGGKVRVVGIIM